MKLECHHIVQKFEGGSDTLENCIVLCFDCHADMRSYDHLHPKGTKYSPEELRIHRDSWLKKISNSGYTEESSEYEQDVDRMVFKRIVELLPWQGAISFIRDHNFEDTYRGDNIRELYRFCQTSRHDPAFEFMNVTLETRRADLTEKVRELNSVLAINAAPLSNPELYRIGPHRELEDPTEQEQQAADLANNLADQCVEAYRDFVRQGKRCLGIVAFGGD